MAEVARQDHAFPIATGERLTTKYEFLRVLHDGRRLDPADECRVGSAASSRLRRSPAWQRPSMPRWRRISTTVPVGAAASIQLAVTLPNFLIQEAILDFGDFHAACSQDQDCV